MEKSLYKNGNIISLTLTNFQTFKNTTISFSPTINFILGPNGSGKSTISNALSFIFGGNPKTIGKAKQLKEYIRFGEEKCKIEAKIFFNNEIVCLTRSMSHTTNSYYLNQNCVKKNVYDDFIDKLKININNLCQYLPQEKVSEFSRMSPEELLIQTCISLDKSSLIENLNEIKENEYKLFEFANKENTMKIEKNNIKNFVENIYKDVEKIKEKERKTLRIEMMEIKKIWLEYENMKGDYKRLINNLKLLKKSFKENNLESETIKEKIEKIKKSPLNLEMIKKIQNFEKWDNELKEKIENFKEKKHKEAYLQADIENLEKRKEKNKKEAEKINEEIERDKEDLKKEKELIKNKLKESKLIKSTDSLKEGCKKKKIEDKIEKIMRRFEDFEGDECGNSRVGCECGNNDGSKNDYIDHDNDLPNHNSNLNPNPLNPNPLNPNNNHDISLDDVLINFNTSILDEDTNLFYDLNRKKQQIMNNSIEIKSKFDSLEDKKKKINEEGERRLELLKRYHSDTYSAVIWLRDNKSLFSKEIIEPTFLHLNITNEKFTPEIEIFLSFTLMTSFICKDPNDFIKFMKKIKDEKNLRINAIEEIKNDDRDGMGRNDDGRKIGNNNHFNNNDFYKSLGFDGVILDFINVRKETKDFLIAHGHFDSIPLTKSLLNDKKIFEKTNIKRFAMNSKFFEIKRSRYNEKDFIIHSSSINPKNLFTKKIDTSEIENELKKLSFERNKNEQELKTILIEIEDLNSKINKMKIEKNEYDKNLNFIKSKINLFNMTIRAIKQKRNRFKELENDKNYKNSILKIKNELENLKNEKINIKNDLILIFRDEDYLKLFKNCMGLFKEINSEFKSLDFLESNLQILNKNIKEIKNQIENQEETKKKLKIVMNEKKKEMMKSVNKKFDKDEVGGDEGVGGRVDGMMVGGRVDGDEMVDDDVKDRDEMVDDDKGLNKIMEVDDDDKGLNDKGHVDTQQNNSINSQMKLLPNSIEELNSEIIKEKTQLKFINVSEEAKIEYENKKNQLDKILNELENTTNTKKSYEDKVKEIKSILIKDLILLTEKIDKEFQNLFKQMGCEGKIEFVYKNGGDNCSRGDGNSKGNGCRGSDKGSKNDDMNNKVNLVDDNLPSNHTNHANHSKNFNNFNNHLPCKNWKLNILVKFREKEKLEILSSFRQSGGEKSVSTILFLLALQKVDTSPFRLVDEINQGMDKDNEKSILNILFKMNLNEKTQFFIISPKLVEGLDYNENMKIIILFSDQPGAVKRAFIKGR